jgi:hypothetical protein
VEYGAGRLSVLQLRENELWSTELVDSAIFPKNVLMWFHTHGHIFHTYISKTIGGGGICSMV